MLRDDLLNRWHMVTGNLLSKANKS